MTARCDEVDLEIIAALQSDGNKPHAALAARCSVSPATFSRRVVRLINDGVIRHTVIVSRDVVEFEEILMIIRSIGNDNLAERLAALPHVREIRRVLGDKVDGLLVKMCARTSAELLEHAEALRCMTGVIVVQSMRSTHVFKDSHVFPL